MDKFQIWITAAIGFLILGPGIFMFDFSYELSFKIFLGCAICSFACFGGAIHSINCPPKEKPKKDDQKQYEPIE